MHGWSLWKHNEHSHSGVIINRVGVHEHSFDPFTPVNLRKGCVCYSGLVELLKRHLSLAKRIYRLVKNIRACVSGGVQASPSVT